LLGLSSVEAPTICLQARAYCSAPSSETPLVRKRMRRAQVKSVQEFRVISKTKTARFMLYSEKNWPFVSHIHWLVQYLPFRSFPTCRHHANAHGSISVRIGVQSIEHTSCILTPEVGVLRYFDVIPSLPSIGKNKICSSPVHPNWASVTGTKGTLSGGLVIIGPGTAPVAAGRTQLPRVV